MEFEWDPDKAVRNLAKHGVAFYEAATVFGDPLAVTFFDPDHSEDEDRYLTFGQSTDRPSLVVSHADRQDHTRIISRVERHGVRGISMKEDEISHEYR